MLPLVPSDPRGRRICPQKGKALVPYPCLAQDVLDIIMC